MLTVARKERSKKRDQTWGSNNSESLETEKDGTESEDQECRKSSLFDVLY